MGDLPYSESTQAVEIYEEASGYSAKVTSDGNLRSTDYANGPVAPGTVAPKSTLIGGQFKTSLPTLADGEQAAIQVDNRGRILVVSFLSDPLPAAEVLQDSFINAGATAYKTYTAAIKLAMKQFYAGGAGAGKQTVWYYYPTQTELLTYGDFESAGDVAQWTVVDPNGNLPTVSYSTDQAYTNTGSCKIVYTKSDINNYTGLKRTFSPAVDYTVWKYVTAAFYNIPPAGGAVTRTISIILTDTNGSTKTFSVSGLTTTGVSPFGLTGWVPITGDIRNPTSTTGTSFDGSQVVSLELRFVDSGNKAGTCYWDSVIFKERMTMIFPIFHQATLSFNLPIDPIKILEIGDKIIITQTSLDTVRKEYYAFIGAIAI